MPKSSAILNLIHESILTLTREGITWMTRSANQSLSVVFNKLGLIALTALILINVTPAKAKPSINIVGGVEAVQNDFPFIASLHSSSGRHFCGGTLIRSNWIMTAGHCVDGIRVAKIYVGAYDQKNLSTAESFTPLLVIKHEKYDDNTTDYDFALIKLSGHSKATPVALNMSEIFSSEDVAQTTMAISAGWGTTSEGGFSLPNILRKVSLPMVPDATCKDSYGADSITAQMICAGVKEGGIDTCQGDSGGPLLITQADGSYALAGVVSWGQGCARPEYYGVYSKVSSQLLWAETHITTNQ